jgi:large subunit ribosomal protein L25
LKDVAQTIKLTAQARSEVGSSKSRSLRREGWIPAVLYGPDLEQGLSLQVNLRELNRVLAEMQGGIISLDVQQGEETVTYPVMIKGIQRDRLKNNITHLDFYLVSMTRKVTTSVPILLVGTAPGVRAGGILQHQLWEVEIQCLPDRLPENIEADISALEIGQTLTVKELQAIEGVEVLTPEDDVVVSILEPGLAEDEESEAAEEPAGVGKEAE